MPTHYVELTEEEMSYVDGGFSWRIFAGIGCIIVGGILNIAGAICSSNGNTGAGMGLNVAGTIISTVGGVILGIPGK